LSKKVEITYLVGIFLFSFGIFSVIYVVVVIIINLSVGYTGVLLRTKDIVFDFVFIVLGALLIWNKKVILKSKASV
jgi:hypothetical protein